MRGGERGCEMKRQLLAFAIFILWNVAWVLAVAIFPRQAGMDITWVYVLAVLCSIFCVVRDPFRKKPRQNEQNQNYTET